MTYTHVHGNCDEHWLVYENNERPGEDFFDTLEQGRSFTLKGCPIACIASFFSKSFGFSDKEYRTAESKQVNKSVSRGHIIWSLTCRSQVTSN